MAWTAQQTSGITATVKPQASKDQRCVKTGSLFGGHQLLRKTTRLDGEALWTNPKQKTRSPIANW